MNGQIFRQKREALGMSQQELAEKLMITQPRMAQVEHNYKAPSVAMVELAAKVFGCTTDELIFGTKDEKGA